jgi:hypothetical protein
MSQTYRSLGVPVLYQGGALPSRDSLPEGQAMGITASTRGACASAHPQVREEAHSRICPPNEAIYDRQRRSKQRNDILLSSSSTWLAQCDRAVNVCAPADCS